MNVKIKKLHPDAQIPLYATPLSAGFDLVAVKDVVIGPGETKKIPTGLAFEISEGYELQVRPRSGVSSKTRLRVSNSPGTIDADYRGEVAVLIDNTERPSGYHEKLVQGFYGLDGEFHESENYYVVGTYIIHKGERIAQGIIAPVVRASFEVVDELSETERGSGGFGHSGVN